MNMLMELFNTDHKLSYTDEQIRIINKVVFGKSLIINAYAGTGKTTTLIGISENFKGKKLYLAYNKKISDEAKKKFKNNTQIFTTHSLAHKHVKKVLNLDTRDLGNITTYSLMEKLNLKYEIAFLSNYLFRTLLQTPYKGIEDENFINYISRDNYFIYEVLPDYIIKRYGYWYFKDIIQNQEKVSNLIRNICHNYSTYVKDIDEMIIKNELAMPHDYYLKKFYEMLSEQEINLKYDLVMIDEAQDSNELTLAIIEKISKNKVKVLVGDKYQQIYGFRGADNIMEKAQNCEREYLTYSFRFGKNIADRLNQIVKKYLNEDINIKGLGGERSNEKVAIIARTNSALIPHGIENSAFSISRSVEDIFFVPMQVYYFVNGMYEKIDNRFSFWKNINGLVELEELARSIKDKETINAIKMYNRYGKGLLKIKNEFANKVKKDANLELTTAHSSKGLEYDTVIIESDFEDFEVMKREIRNEFDKKAYREEINLYYVAVSRAIKKCIDKTVNI